MAVVLTAGLGRLLRLVWKVIRLFLFFLVLVVGYLAVTAVQVWLTSRHSDPRPAQAVVVMGAAQYDGVPSPDLAARLSDAYGLWHRRSGPSRRRHRVQGTGRPVHRGGGLGRLAPGPRRSRSRHHRGRGG